MLSRRLAHGATLVVEDKLAAVQLEAYVAREGDLLGATAWRSPSIQTHADWSASLWTSNFDRDRLLLSGPQIDALWRRVVEASPSGAGLIDTSRIAAWSRQAWGLLHAWQLDFHELSARDDDPGFRDFLQWAFQFEDTLASSGWLDHGTLVRLIADGSRLADPVPGEVICADLRSETPALQTLLRTLEQVGCSTSTWAPETPSRSVYRVGLEDTQQELRHAVSWACRKTEAAPNARVAVVVPQSVESEIGLARYFDHAAPEGFSGYGMADGASVAREPAIGAALDCLGLFSRRADFQRLSRWLRSPFVGNGAESLAARCTFEAELRGELVAQLDFSSAYRAAGLDRRLGRRLPMLRAALDSAFARLTGAARYQSPTRWAALAQELLGTLGWPGSESSVPATALDGWQRALEELAALTPVLGPIDYERALSELRIGVSRARRPGRVAIEGITILSRLEDLGPGYDAAWIMGMGDRFWPRPAEPNPLLPYSLQAVHEMPFATPADAVQRCRALTQRLIARVPEIVFSYPLLENEFAAEVSPLLREVPEMDAGSLPALTVVYAPGSQERTIETLDDPVPPFSGNKISGGAGTLAKQALCPLRAFIDSRLSVRPLERPERGFGPRQRGILVHRALELLLTALPGQRHLAAQTPEALELRIGDCVDRAIQESVRGAGRTMRVYAAMEHDRLVPLVRNLVTLEVERSEFVVDSLEARMTARIGGLEIVCRIDRVDRLADGSVAVIDYKTGLTATPADWFRARLVEPQLPLYLQVIDGEVEAIVIGRVHPRGVVYRGVWKHPETFPGSSYRPREKLDWPQQRALWGAQLEALVAEYANGDGRIFVDGLAHAEGPYAPLTRVHEQAASADYQPTASRP